MINTQAFSISVVGEVTSETFKGNFSSKKRLSHMDRLRADQFRREYLGPTSRGDAGQVASTIAVALSDLRVRLVDMPKWWIESNYGADLEDWNVLMAVWESAVKVESDAKAGTVTAGEVAAEKLAAPAIKPIA